MQRDWPAIAKKLAAEGWTHRQIGHLFIKTEHLEPEIKILVRDMSRLVNDTA